MIFFREMHVTFWCLITLRAAVFANMQQLDQAAAAAAAPLAIQAAAAASLLRDGVAPEDIGHAAGLANPDDGGGWAPRQLAHLADMVTSTLNDAAVAAATAAAAAAPPDAWNDDDDVSPPGWWDPESLARLLCALTAAGAGGGRHAGHLVGAFMPPADQATLAHVLVTELRWTHGNAGDLLWCVHTAQEASGASASASAGGGGGRGRGTGIGGVMTSARDEGGLDPGPTTMARVEECAEVVLELARARRAIRGGGCGWNAPTRPAYSDVARARLGRARDGGLTAVKGCARSSRRWPRGSTGTMPRGRCRRRRRWTLLRRREEEERGWSGGGAGKCYPPVRERRRRQL